MAQRAADEMTGSLRKLLNWMYEAVESDLEVLSDKGQDRMFSAASGLMEKVHGLLMISNLSTLDAEELVRRPNTSLDHTFGSKHGHRGSH